MGHPANEVVANLHHSALNQHRAHRSLTPASLALYDDSPGKSLRSRFQFKDFRLKLNHFQQFIDAVTPGGGDVDKDVAGDDGAALKPSLLRRELKDTLNAHKDE